MNLRKLLRIARWETTKGVAGIDRRVALALAATLLVTAAAVPALAATGFALDDGLYRVGVAESDPLYDPVVAEPTFAVGEPSRAALESGRVDVLVRNGRVVGIDGQKGRAAVAELRNTVAAYNDARMAEESNASAAFPVTVTLQFADRSETVVAGDTVAEEESATEDTVAMDTASPSSVDRGGTAGGGGTLPAINLFGSGTTTGSPSDITPPFPLESLVLAFLFVLPLNFLVQAYGSTMLRERLNRRGELLLVAPLSPADIVAGKTLPYLLAALAMLGGITLLVGGGPLSLFGAVPLALLFLAATFVAAMFARSFAELTFLSVGISVGLTTFAFVPAVFAEVGGVGLVSPLTLVVRDLTGEGVSLAGAVLATLPATLTAVVCYGFGLGLYREEDLFTQRPVRLKLLDALAGRITRVRSLVVVTGLIVPFIFVAELLAIATLFALPVAVSVPAVLIVVAVIEEVAKSVPVLAGFEHARYPRTPRWAVAAGVASGTGFFLGEKLALLAQLVGLGDLAVATAALGPDPTTLAPLAALGLLIAPLMLHAVTAACSSVGGTRGRTGWAVGLAVAVAVHLAYNAAVLGGMGT